MSEINPELAVSEVASDKQGAAKLFGSAAPVIRNALGRFFDKRPGALDEHNLRLIAASAPDVKDPKLVAELIDGLAITGMQIAMRPVEIETARPMFERSISSYPPKTRQALVADLVRQNTLGVLLFAPPESLTPGARAVVEDHLLELAAGDQASQATAVRSPFVTRPVIDKVLAKIEERIERSERGTDRREPTKMPLEVVADGLAQILHRDTLHTTTEDVTRAWQLVKRCSVRSDGLTLRSVLSSATSNPKLDEPTARSVLDTIEDYRPIFDSVDWGETVRHAWRGAMLCVPEMPEVVAQKAARRRTSMPTGGTSDLRMYAFRKHYYKPFGRRPLARPLSDDQLDRAMLNVPRELLAAETIQRIRNSRVLKTLSERAGSLDTRQLRALIHNPDTPPDATFDNVLSSAVKTSLVDRLTVRSSRRQDVHSHLRYLIVRELITDPRLDDDRLVELSRSVEDPAEQHELVNLAAEHPSAGHGVIDEIIRTDGPDSRRLARLARVSARPDIHRRLFEIASQYADATVDDHSVQRFPVSTASEILDSLAGNGTVGVDILGEAAPPPNGMSSHRPEFEPLYERPIRRQANHNVWRRKGLLRPENSPDHAPGALAQRIIEGSIPADRIGMLVDLACRQGALEQVSQTAKALSLLAEHGHLSPEHWAALTGTDDTHTAMHFALHASCPPAASNLQQPGSENLRSTAEALESGASQLERRPRSWSDLPNASDVPFPSSPVVDLIEGQNIEDKELVVVRTPRQLKRIAKYMGNCLEGYTDGVRRGTTVVAVAEEPNEMTAVAWQVVDADPRRPRIKVQEINTRFNAGAVSDEFRSAVRTMTKQINDGTLTPVDKVPVIDREKALEAATPDRSDRRPATDVDNSQQPMAPPREARRRPQPRHRLDLVVDGEPRSDARRLDEAHAPSLLSTVDDTLESGRADPRDIVGGETYAERSDPAHDSAASPPNEPPEVAL